ncbi:uncharacterized [Tachysurus ichikawai]
MEVAVSGIECKWITTEQETSTRLPCWLGFGPPAHSGKTYLIPENLCQEGVTLTTIPAHIRPQAANLEPSRTLGTEIMKPETSKAV